MKKETLTEKLIKRIYGISGPLDEHKRREVDRIGNQVFIVPLLSDDFWQPHPSCPRL